jgi:hypothetical protein
VFTITLTAAQHAALNAALKIVDHNELEELMGSEFCDRLAEVVVAVETAERSS